MNLNFITDVFISTAIGIGGFIFISILTLNLIMYYLKDKFSDAKIQKFQVLLGSLLGLTPGCGGAVAVSNLYRHKKVSLGTLVATFITTMGEGTFLLLVANGGIMIKDFLLLSLISLVLGVIVGYVIDHFKIEINFKTKEIKEKDLHREIPQIVSKISHQIVENKGLIIIYVLGFILTPFSFLDLFGIGFEDGFMHHFVNIVAVSFISYTIIYYLVDKLIHQTHYCILEDNLKDKLLHGAKDLAMIMFFITIGIIITSYFIDEVIGESVFENFMNSIGFLVIVGSVLLGAIPGCTAFVVIVVLYMNGSIPFSALLAASIATNGDAAFPLMTIDKKVLGYVTLITSVLALIVGTVVYMFGY